ncbi:restriction endonuclease subunit S [Shewanella sp. A32]|uniref:restriction endonuclease subunit S n=1 Tax=Shewanella sp. A32 TaxID=3031327 RepID=UPI0023B9B692|nr:restriction endonuclease subunit S [Shewanella sp. A32]MDF0534936.1 restriction endonuclease subunit S [Shewanella sp. A32]
MSWPMVKLGDVCALVNGDRGKNYPSKEALFSDGIPFINAGNLQNDLSIKCEGANYITEERFSLLSNGKVQVNDILFCLRGSLGKFAIVGKEISKGAIASSLVIIRPKCQLNNSFLKNYLRSSLCKREIERFENGAAQPNLSAKDLKEFLIPLPPLAEQQRIAAILDKADAIRQKRQQAIKLADDFLRSVFLEMFGDPVTNPKGWTVGTIRDLVTSVNYGTSAKASETDGEFPILRMGNITYEGKWDFTDLKYIDLSEKDQDKYLAKKGDLLFNRTNSKELVGKTAVFNEEESMAIAGYLIRVRTNELGNPWYISAYLNSIHGKQTLLNMCKSIVGMANINAQELQDIQIMLPPLSLQDRFASIVNAVNERLSKNAVSSNYLTDLFNALSQKAFSGQL